MMRIDWHLVRSGQFQLFGSRRHASGDAFQFIPLFRTHREAEHFCRQSGLWQQGLRPKRNGLLPGETATSAEGLASLIRDACRDGVRIVGVFVGFDSDLDGQWNFFHATLSDRPPEYLTDGEAFPVTLMPCDSESEATGEPMQRAAKTVLILRPLSEDERPMQ